MEYFITLQKYICGKSGRRTNVMVCNSEGDEQRLDHIAVETLKISIVREIILSHYFL